MHIHSGVTIAALLPSIILFVTGLPTPLLSGGPTILSHGNSPCKVVGTDSMWDIALDNVCVTPHNDIGLPPTMFGDEHELQARAPGTSPVPRYVTVHDLLRDLLPDTDRPEKITAPPDPSEIPQEDQERVYKILRMLKKTLSDLQVRHSDTLSRRFRDFKRDLKSIGYRVDFESTPHARPLVGIPITTGQGAYEFQAMQGPHRTITIPPILRENLQYLPEKIAAPTDPSKIIPEDQRHVYVILAGLKASIHGLRSDNPRRRKFRDFKKDVKTHLGYKVNFEELMFEAPPPPGQTIGTAGQAGVHGSGGESFSLPPISGLLSNLPPPSAVAPDHGETTFQIPAGQSGESGGQGWILPPPSPSIQGQLRTTGGSQMGTSGGEWAHNLSKEHR